jgi:hypothetical protein
MEFDKRYALAGLIITAFVLLGITAIPNRPVDEHPSTVEVVTEHGAITLYVDSTEGDILPSRGTIEADKDLVVKWEADVSTSDIDAWLYTVAGTQIEEATHTQESTDHFFTFTLDGAPEGNTECYVGFGGQYSTDKRWVGSTVHFFISQTGTPDYPEPEFVEIPEPDDAKVGDNVQFRWTVIYTGPCVARFTIDGVTQSSRTMTPTSSEQPMAFYHAFSEVGLHKAKLILEPEYDIPYASEVTIQINPADNATTTTDTTTPTDATNTTTEEPEGFVWTVEAVITIVLLVVVIIIICIRECLRED